MPLNFVPNQTRSQGSQVRACHLLLNYWMKGESFLFCLCSIFFNFTALLPTWSSATDDKP
jgi:hypothetical protein